MASAASSPRAMRARSATSMSVAAVTRARRTAIAPHRSTGGLIARVMLVRGAHPRGRLRRRGTLRSARRRRIPAADGSPEAIDEQSRHATSAGAPREAAGGLVIVEVEVPRFVADDAAEQLAQHRML